MKRWKKYVLCAICACCVGLLAGCGNKNDGSTETENATETTETRENRRETPQAATDDNRVTNPDGTNGNRPDDTGEDTVNDVTDPDGADTGVGGAAEDLVDGVGDAGKDLIDGVEDAGDALTGEDANRNTTGE